MALIPVAFHLKQCIRFVEKRGCPQQDKYHRKDFVLFQVAPFLVALTPPYNRHQRLGHLPAEI